MWLAACGAEPEPAAPSTTALAGAPCDAQSDTVACQLLANGREARLVCTGDAWQQVAVCPAGQRCVAQPPFQSVCSATVGQADGQSHGDGGAGDVAIDAGGLDVGLDATPMDSGTPDSGSADSGNADSGSADSGNADADTQNTGTSDSSAPDTSDPDTSAPDTGAPDTGAPDSGVFDVGPSTCGNGLCEPAENAVSCPKDCDTNAPVCGDGQCSDLEAIPTCAVDCDPKAKQVWTCAAQTCPGQRVACNVKATCMSAVQTAMQCFKVCGFNAGCMSKCAKELDAPAEAKALGACALPGCLNLSGVCGDGACQSGETPQSCAQDCKSGCGDGSCQGGETPQTCPQDCKAPPKVTCGDETCGSGEDAATCPLDCDSGAAAAWSCLQSKCASEKVACQAEPACLVALNNGAVCVKKCGGGSACLQQCQSPILANSKATSLAVCSLQGCANP